MVEYINDEFRKNTDPEVLFMGVKALDKNWHHDMLQMIHSYLRRTHFRDEVGIIREIGKRTMATRSEPFLLFRKKI